MVDGEHTEEEPFRVRIPPKWIEVELIWQDGFAKTLVSRGLCQRVLVQSIYSIGISEPISVYVDTYGTGANGKIDKELSEIVKGNFDMKLGKIIKELKLTRPIFTKTATGGHLEENALDFTWEIPKEIKIN